MHPALADSLSAAHGTSQQIHQHQNSLPGTDCDAPAQSIAHLLREAHWFVQVVTTSLPVKPSAHVVVALWWLRASIAGLPSVGRHPPPRFKPQQILSLIPAAMSCLSLMLGSGRRSWWLAGYCCCCCCISCRPGTVFRRFHRSHRAGGSWRVLVQNR
jgi:hypothetical protein